MNITKEQADKVIAALAYAKARILSEWDDDCIVTAYNIMRGLSEDAEPVNRCITELLAFAKDHPGTYIFPSWDGSRVMKYLATSPQAAQTAVKSESLAQAAQAPARLPSEGKTIEALAPIQAAQTDERNGCLSNCRNCQHFRRDTGGHCYMFKDEPQGVCAKWIASNTLAFGFPSNWAGRKG